MTRKVNTKKEEKQQESPQPPKTKIVKPGAYPGVDFDEYASWDAVNASTLNTFSKTPAHVYYEMTHGGKDSTQAMDLGWMVHLAVLEPEKFADTVVACPLTDKRTKAGKAAWADFEAKNAGKYITSEKEFEKVEAMAKSVLSHETAAAFFSGPGQNEISIVWEESSVLCKARIDRISKINESPVVGDFKTARTADRRSFEKAIYDFGYHVQGAHYLAGLEVLYPVPAGAPDRSYVFIVVENQPPYCTAVYELEDVALDEGKTFRDQYLKQWKECMASGVWPGYSSGMDYAGLPAWAYKIYRG